MVIPGQSVSEMQRLGMIVQEVRQLVHVPPGVSTTKGVGRMASEHARMRDQLRVIRRMIKAPCESSGCDLRQGLVAFLEGQPRI